MSLPAWLHRQLLAAGKLDADGISRQVRSRTHTCGARILTGLDADRAAGAAVVDPWPISLWGEMLATVAGRQTYDLAGVGRLELDHRYAAKIEGPRRWPVVAEHLCGAPRLPDDPDPPGYRIARQPDSDIPPY